jgi:hypothetical protein
MPVVHPGTYNPIIQNTAVSVFPDSRGGLTGSFNAHEYIQHIAMSSDGSVIVATSDERVYAFSPGSFPKINSAPSRTMTPEKNIPEVSPAQTPVLATIASVAPPQAPTTATPTGLPATYSIIRTATRSPPSYSTLICSLVLAFLLLGKKQKT